MTEVVMETRVRPFIRRNAFLIWLGIVLFILGWACVGIPNQFVMARVAAGGLDHYLREHRYTPDPGTRSDEIYEYFGYVGNNPTHAYEVRGSFSSPDYPKDGPMGAEGHRFAVRMSWLGPPARYEVGEILIDDHMVFTKAQFPGQ